MSSIPIEIAILIGPLLTAVVVYLAVRLFGRGRGVSESESRLSARLDSLLSEVSKIRDESKGAVQDKIGELFGQITDENRQARKESRESLESVTRSLTDRFEKLQKSNEEKLAQIREEVEKKLLQTIDRQEKSFDKVTERLSDLRVTNDRIMQFSRDLQQIQSIMQAPRMRGEIGEIEMERLLRQCLAPEQFEMQHPIEGGRVDAVIFNPEGKLPIDSKFPLEAWRRSQDTALSEDERKTARREFQRAVKKHIDDISGKYIHPPQTLDFAVMYIPAEGVYYEVIETPELTEHARLKRVFPSSPTTFWALLQVTVMGFRGMKISERAQHISGLITALKGDMQKFKETFQRAAKQVDNAQANINVAARQLDKVDTRLDSIQAPQVGDDRQMTALPGEEDDAPNG